MTPATLPFERRLSEFDRTVAAAQRELILQVKLALKEDMRSRSVRLLQVARVTAILDQLGAYVDPAIRRLVAEAYHQSAEQADKQITKLPRPPAELPGAFAGVSVEAVAILQDAAQATMRDARARIGRQVQDVYAKAARMAVTRAVLGVDGSPRTAARLMALDLRKDRQVAAMIDGPGFIDAAGRKWTLDRYTTMAVRTITREAVVQGAVDRMASHGITLARVISTEGACDICKPYVGKLIDLAGAGQAFDGEPVITGPLPPYHPHCRCTVSPVAVRVERLRRELAGRT